MIEKVIFQLKDSRELAIKRLKKRYGVATTDPGNNTCDTGKQQSKLLPALESAAKKTGRKLCWVSGEDSLIERLADETFKLHEGLFILTGSSMHFLLEHRERLQNSQRLEAGLAQLASPLQQYVEKRNTVRGKYDPMASPTEDESIDDQTLAGYASKSILSTEQRERVLDHIDKSLEAHGDTRISEKIANWWNDDSTELMLLELPENTGQRTSTSACVLLYFLVDCHKLIFVFEPAFEMTFKQQLLSMVRTFLQSLVSLRGNKPLGGLTLPFEVTQEQFTDESPEVVQKLLISFYALLEDTTRQCDRRVLLIVDGLELSNFDRDGDSSQLVRHLVSGLQNTCDSLHDEPGTALKVLLAHNGNATNLYEVLGSTNAVDLTGYGSRMTSVKDGLVSLLNH